MSKAKDYEVKIAEKVEALLQKMTLREKVGQVTQIALIGDIEAIKEKIRRGEVGSLILAGDAYAGHSSYSTQTEMLDELQRIAVEESPHGIPVINGKDIIHGHNTGFPLPLACASTFNPDLVEKAFSAAGREAASEGIHWSFAPMMDIAHDPRWGRVVEGAGEDPYLDGKCAAAAVRGFQGHTPEEMAKPGKIAACAKHYIGYGASEGGRDYNRTEISDYTLRNLYLPPFHEAVKAGVSTVMSSFNEISGQPTTSSRYLLTDLLRGELGFKGYIISDWGAIYQLVNQGVAADGKECARLAFNAGLDMDMVDNCYIDHLEELVAEGAVPMEYLDQSVRRILRIKYMVGLFEHPYIEDIPVDYDAHMRLEKEIATECAVLLKNNGVLPLDKSADVCLTGPFAEDRQNVMGCWTLAKSEWTVTIKDAMEKTGENVNYVSSLIPLEAEREMRRHEVIVLALGESRAVSGEARSVSDLELSEECKALAKAARLSGKKVVGVFACGRPLALQSVEPYFDAILYAWQSGNAIGPAVADLLFGNACPSGKTAITFPRVTGQVPLYYNVSGAGRPVNDYYYNDTYSIHSYEDCYGSPLYPFGYGLSYTAFDYEKPVTDVSEIRYDDLKNGAKFRVTVKVTNIGDRDGKEVVECYLHDKLSRMTRPLRELCGFEKVFLRKGETVAVTFELGFDELGYYGADGVFDVEPGVFEIYTGKNCLDVAMTEINVLR